MSPRVFFFFSPVFFKFKSLYEKSPKNDALPSPFPFWSPTQIFSPFGNHVVNDHLDHRIWALPLRVPVHSSLSQQPLPHFRPFISSCLFCSQVSVHPTPDLAPLTVSATFAKVKTSNQDHHMQLCRLRSACDCVTIC